MSSVSSSGTAESSTKRKYNDSYLSVGLRMQVMKLPLLPYASCATNRHHTVLGYLPNFVHFVTPIAMNIRTKILVLSGISVRH
jgi:hypothetical protein